MTASILQSRLRFFTINPVKKYQNAHEYMKDEFINDYVVNNQDVIDNGKALSSDLPIDRDGEYEVYDFIKVTDPNSH